MRILLKSEHGPRTRLQKWATLALILYSWPVFAQDALRSWIAGDAADVVQRAQLQNVAYTLRSGDFRLLTIPSVELDWNDNVNASASAPQSDFIVRPMLQLTGSYPLTQQNLLSLSAGIGYDEYLEHNQYNSFYLNSGSVLSFDVRVKDFSINLHDRAQFTQDTGSQGAVSGTAFFGGLLNIAGIVGTWHLHDVVLTLGYDHQNYLSASGLFDYLNRASELPLARAGFRFSPDLTVGLESTASFTSYEQKVLNNNQSYSMGVYADWQPGSSFHVQPRAGYLIYHFDQTSQSAQVFEATPNGSLIAASPGQTIQTSDLNSWYVDVTVSHQIRKAISYSVGVGREIQLGVQSDAIQSTYIRPTVNWSIIKDLTLQANINYERDQQGLGNISGNISENYDFLTAGLSAGYPITKKLSLRLNYRHTLRSSDLEAGTYSQDVLGLQLIYGVK